jgi:hypothetical protein
LLSRSLEAFAPSGEHWIVVDRADLPLFRSLENGRTTLVATEEVLPVWLRRLNLACSVSARTSGSKRVESQSVAGSYSS